MYPIQNIKSTTSLGSFREDSKIGWVKLLNPGFQVCCSNRGTTLTYEVRLAVISLGSNEIAPLLVRRERCQILVRKSVNVLLDVSQCELGLKVLSERAA